VDEAVALPLGPSQTTTMLKRLGTAAVAIPLLVWIVAWAPPTSFVVLVVAASAGAAWELARLKARDRYRGYAWLAVVASAALTWSFATPVHPAVPISPAIVLTLGVAAVLTAPMWMGGGANAEAVADTLLALVYVGWLLGYAILLHRTVGGSALVLFVIGLTWCGEAAAYFVGSAIGRHPLAPVLSPRKTVEGGVAQLAVSMLAALPLAAWLLPECSALRVVGAGAVVGVLGQFGDLAESALKRSAGVKDASALLPGHGGVLDRLDSLLFNVPAFYYYWTFFGC
jgi:phosphatidate cytidylyltransferase